MKLTKLKIKNILGIDDIEFDAGKFTTITGANSSGKSSIAKTDLQFIITRVGNGELEVQ